MATIFGNQDDNELFGTGADDRIYGRGGRDILHGGGGHDRLLGGDGNDDLYIDIRALGVGGWDSGVHAFGDGGIDRAIVDMRVVTTDIFISSQFDQIFYKEQDGSGWAPSMVSLHSVEVLTAYMGSGNDYYHSSGGQGNRAYGGFGNDRLIGGGVDDYLDGEQGDDIIDAGSGVDEAHGGAGNDFIRLGAGDDGGSGDDGDDILYGDDGSDAISGGAGDDRLIGGSGVDSLVGDLGNDILFGEEGNDGVYGREGNDRLNGGMGEDILIGGPGWDRFIWRSAAEGGDRIVDFTVGQDLLLFDGDGFGGITEVNASNFVSNTLGRATDADDRFLYKSGTGSLYFDPDGNGPAAKIYIALIENGAGPDVPVLTHADFVIV